jgi:hypothetical protein
MKQREILVGANGFEPSTSWSRTRRASQAALRPDKEAQAELVRPKREYQINIAPQWPLAVRVPFYAGLF